MSERGHSPGPPGSPARSVHTPTRSRSSSVVQQGTASPMLRDPAKPVSKSVESNKRLELPADAFLTATQKSVFALRGNRLNSEGQPINVEINQYRMTGFNFNKIFQYDVTVSPDIDKKAAVLKKIWAHKATKTALAKYNYPMWVFDGHKLAWAACPLDRNELRYMVDLDEDKRPAGAPVREGARFYVKIQDTTVINMAALHGYLEQKATFDSSLQEALNFVDHLIRQYPSQFLLAIKRNFYDQSARGTSLMQSNSTIEVHKGIYASLRMSHNLARGGIGLALNVDVANTCFWLGVRMDAFLSYLATCDGRRWQGMNSNSIIQHLRPVKARDGKTWASSDAWKHLRKLRKLRFKVRHNGQSDDNDKVYTVQDFVFEQSYGAEGAHAKNFIFERDNGEKISVADHFKQKYGAVLKNAYLPLIDAGKPGKFPIEFAAVDGMQRYAFKLNPEQTAAMIKVAVTRPQTRRADIQRNVSALKHSEDPFLKAYGVKFDTGFTKTDARLLPRPKVDFRQGSAPADPKFAGRWDLRGKKFWSQNIAPLQSWGFIVLENCVNLPQLQQFAQTFRQTFLGHGGNSPQDALLLNLPGNVSQNVAEAVAWAHGEISSKRGYTQLLFIVVPQRNSPYYECLKKSADCRFGILSQVVNCDAVKKNNGQYHSNVCMKVNAKLCGATSRTMAPWRSQPTYFPKERPTMIIGVDISHAAPGNNAASTAAMTMSVDRDATRYGAVVETNGYRREMLTPENVHFMFGQLSKSWQVGHQGAFPGHIIYFRDGVSEGQFQQVLDHEITPIKEYLRSKAPKMDAPCFTVLVATKRHHIRIFPQRGDKNGNALPGTLVEKEVTRPFMLDFYLCSHVAIQGTARPVHYHVILDEMNVPINDLQKMIYH